MVRLYVSNYKCRESIESAMGLKSKITSMLPYSESPEIRKRVEMLFSREMLGAVLIGKFIGDYAAIKTVQLLGTDIGYISGIFVTVGVFIYWEKIHRKAQQQSDKINPAQTRISKWEDSEKSE
jgi:hypothetical protein